MIIHTHSIAKKQKIKPSPRASIPLKIIKNSDELIKIFNWSLKRNNVENTQNIWNVNLIFALIFFISSKKETIESNKQNPKIIFQLLFSVSSIRKITDVENKISGIKIIPAKFGELASGLIGDGRMAEPQEIFNITINKSNLKVNVKNITLIKINNLKNISLFRQKLNTYVLLIIKYIMEDI